MRHKFSTRLLSLLLVIVTLAGLLIPASAASLSGSGTVRITQDGFGNYLNKTSGGTIGGGYWKYTSNDGLTGSAYCVNWGLTGVSPSKALTVQPYSRNPQTMGAFTNGYPNRTLAQFKELHPNDVRGIAQLTETEYKYATQVAVRASCGQISVPGTSFTAGRTAVVQPTSDARQIRIFDSVKAILALSEHWTKYLYPGLTIRAEENQNVPGVEVVHERGLEGAASSNADGIKKETINGKEYYTRVMYVASATTTWIDGYTTKVYSTDAPEGTIFVAENNSTLETVQENGATCYKVNTQKNRPTGLNANGEEYYGAFKVCIPADNVADEGSFTIKATGGAAQFNLFLANNPSSTEQSYIISDPAYTTVEASAPFKWSKTGTEDGSASLEIVKTGPGGGPLEGAEFTLTGDRGTTVTGTSGPDGKVTWTGLPADEKFTLTETKAPEGCQPIAGMSVTLEAGRTNYITVPNDTAKGFTVKKIDAQNRGSLQGAVFVFEQIDGDYKTTGTTGFDGQISFEGDELPYGSYRVWEQSPPEGYQKDTRIETVEWTGEKDVLGPRGADHPGGRHHRPVQAAHRGRRGGGAGVSGLCDRRLPAHHRAEAQRDGPVRVHQLQEARPAADENQLGWFPPGGRLLPAGEDRGRVPLPGPHHRFQGRNPVGRAGARRVFPGGNRHKKRSHFEPERTPCGAVPRQGQHRGAGKPQAAQPHHLQK